MLTKIDNKKICLNTSIYYKVMEYETALKKIGLTEKETKVYLANLRLGSSTANTIADRANVIRTTTYDVLKSLIDQGLISYFIKSGVKYFEAVTPNKILYLLDEKKKAIESVLPDLNKMKESITEKPTAQVYEGIDGLKTIMEDMLKTGKEINGYASMGFYNTLKYYFPGFSKRKAKLKIKSRLIMEKNKETLGFKKDNKKELREMRFMDELAKHNVARYIYGDKLAMVVGGKDDIKGVVLQNQAMVDFEKELFELDWKNAKK
jgi:sugar-specific transcriptional regulator TrmB